mmetsp:Transcript_9945/g.15566  ORF Transcript_9945/g.15566 Transcript_9945/m.15566 type:complete len:96 (-) Transcript_9945:363-650(-)
MQAAHQTAGWQEDIPPHRRDVDQEEDVAKIYLEFRRCLFQSLTRPVRSLGGAAGAAAHDITVVCSRGIGSGVTVGVVDQVLDMSEDKGEQGEVLS